MPTKQNEEEIILLVLLVNIMISMKKSWIMGSKYTKEEMIQPIWIIMAFTLMFSFLREKVLNMVLGSFMDLIIM